MVLEHVDRSLVVLERIWPFFRRGELRGRAASVSIAAVAVVVVYYALSGCRGARDDVC